MVRIRIRDGLPELAVEDLRRGTREQKELAAADRTGRTARVEGFGDDDGWLTANEVRVALGLSEAALGAYERVVADASMVPGRDVALGGPSMLHHEVDAEPSVERARQLTFTPVRGAQLPMSSVHELEAGTVSVGPDGLSEPLELELPAGTTSFMVLLEGSGYPLVGELESPGGAKVVSTEPDGPVTLEQERAVFNFGQYYSMNRSTVSYLGGGEAAMLVPNGDDPRVRAALAETGTWRLRVAGEAGDRVRVRAIAKNAPPAVRRGQLRVHLSFTGSEGRTAATTRADPAFLRELERTQEIFRRAGLELLIDLDGARDVSPEFRSVTVDDDEGASHSRLMRELERGDGVNVVFAQSVMLPGVGTGLAGMSPLPGLPFSPGARNGAVVLSSSDGRGFARTLAHEIGHFLGLWHCTETWDYSARREDTIGDTDASSRCNLMYDGGPRCGWQDVEITPGQAAVLLAHPLVENVG